MRQDHDYTNNYGYKMVLYYYFRFKIKYWFNTINCVSILQIFSIKGKISNLL